MCPFLDRAAVSRAGENVLHRTLVMIVIEDVVRADERDAMVSRHRVNIAQAARVVRSGPNRRQAAIERRSSVNTSRKLRKSSAVPSSSD